MNRITVFILLTILASTSHASNGEFWGVINEREKSIYLAGLRDNFTTYYLLGVKEACEVKDSDFLNNPCSKKALSGFLHKNLLDSVNLLQLVKMVNSLYQDPFNTKLYIHDIAELAIKKSQGINIEKELESLRSSQALAENYSRTGR